MWHFGRVFFFFNLLLDGTFVFLCETWRFMAVSTTFAIFWQMYPDVLMLCSALSPDVIRECKVKVKCTLVQALRLSTGRTAHRGSRGITLLFLERSEGSASLPGRSLPAGKTLYPLYKKLGGHQGRFGQVRKISHPPGFDPRTVQPVASRYTDYATRPAIRECRFV